MSIVHQRYCALLLNFFVFVSYGCMFHCEHCEEQLGPSWSGQDACWWCWGKACSSVLYKLQSKELSWTIKLYTSYTFMTDHDWLILLSSLWYVCSCTVLAVHLKSENVLLFSVVTDSEFASESANFSSVRPSPSPRILGGRKWRFCNVAWIATPAAHVTIRADHTSKTTVQYRQSPRSRRPTFDAVNALQLTVGMLTPNSFV